MKCACNLRIQSNHCTLVDTPVKVIAKSSGKTDRSKEKRYIPERVICCNICNLASTKMKWCKKCKIVRYCSKKCQKIDWNRNNHKQLCQKIRKNGWNKVGIDSNFKG